MSSETLGTIRDAEMNFTDEDRGRQKDTYVHYIAAGQNPHAFS